MRSYINELFARIKKDTELKNSVKIIGIAVGNNKDESLLKKRNTTSPSSRMINMNFINWSVSLQPLFLFLHGQYGNGRLLVLDSYLGKTRRYRQTLFNGKYRF